MPSTRSLITCLCLALAACSGSSDDTAASTTTEFVPPSVDPATSTSESTTTTAATARSSTTEDPITAAEQAATQAVLNKSAAWSECVLRLDECVPETALADTTAGQSLANLTRIANEWKANGWIVRPALDPAHDGEEIVSVDVLSPDATSVAVVMCQVDGGRLVDPEAAPDGTDVIVDDSIVSVLASSVVMLDTDGKWRIYEVDAIERIRGGDGCEREA